MEERRERNSVEALTSKSPLVGGRIGVEELRVHASAVKVSRLQGI
jgi:hypothetical protein